MSEALEKGPITGWENAPEIYADEIVGVAIHQNAVGITLAVNRVEPGKTSGARSVRAVVARIVLPYPAAQELLDLLAGAAQAATLNAQPDDMKH